MVRLGFVWKTRPGACELDPPVTKSGPCSSTVTSVQPRAVSSSARAHPTTPAPTMTTFAPGMGQLPAGIHGFQVASCSFTHFSAALSASMPWLVR
jgi:hypothetical protein